MNGPDVRRLSPGTVTLQMRLKGAAWSYDNDLPARLVDVEVEVRALLRSDLASASQFGVKPTLPGNRRIVELAAQRIIDREGPNFSEPVRVRVADVLFQIAQMQSRMSSTRHQEARRPTEVSFI